MGAMSSGPERALEAVRSPEATVGAELPQWPAILPRMFPASSWPGAKAVTGRGPVPEPRPGPRGPCVRPAFPCVGVLGGGQQRGSGDHGCPAGWMEEDPEPAVVPPW